MGWLQTVTYTLDHWRNQEGPRKGKELHGRMWAFLGRSFILRLPVPQTLDTCTLGNETTRRPSVVSGRPAATETLQNKQCRRVLQYLPQTTYLSPTAWSPLFHEAECSCKQSLPNNPLQARRHFQAAPKISPHNDSMSQHSNTPLKVQENTGSQHQFTHLRKSFWVAGDKLTFLCYYHKNLYLIKQQGRLAVYSFYHCPNKLGFNLEEE